MKNWTFVFDLDGTLVDTAPDLAAATNHVLGSIGLNAISEANIRPHVGHGALAMIAHAAAAHGRTLSERDTYDLFELFLAYYSAHLADSSRPYDDVITTLEMLRGEGARLAVCTNKIEAHARSLLDALGMTNLFAAITGRDSLGVWKPDPGHLTGTVSLARGNASQCIMIGDSETDIKTAKAAGAPVIAVDFGYSIAPVASFLPDIVISHYRELPDALKKLTNCGD